VAGDNFGPSRANPATVTAQLGQYGAKAAQKTDSEACKILRRRSEASQGVLLDYVTGNKNWNNPEVLRGYQSYYQENADQWAVIASRPVQYGAAIVLTFLPAVRWTSKIAGAVGGAAFSDLAATELQLNKDKVQAIQDRINVINAKCQ
jgi:hypothetical protein